MKIANHDTSNRAFIIAEIGNNHEGDYDVALQMIKSAKDAGADAVKFQSIKTEHLISKSDEKRFAQIKGFELSEEQFIGLAKLSNELGVLFMSTPFDVFAVEYLDPHMPAFKVASCDNTFTPLLKAIACKQKPIIMSTGFATTQELEAAVEVINNEWQALQHEGDLALLHCISNYPTLPQDLNLRTIRHLKSYFQVEVGFSDHSVGIASAVQAVAMGATIIEKHFTLDNNYSDFGDHKISLNPSDFKEMVQEIRSAEMRMGTIKQTPNEMEKGSLKAIRRSIINLMDMKQGEKLTLENVTWIRIDGELSAGDEDQIIGKSIKQDTKAGTALSAAMFE